MTFENNQIRITDPSHFGIDKNYNYDDETKFSDVLMCFLVHPISERWIFSGEDIDFAVQFKPELEEKYQNLRRLMIDDPKKTLLDSSSFFHVLCGKDELPPYWNDLSENWF